MHKFLCFYRSFSGKKSNFGYWKAFLNLEKSKKMDIFLIFPSLALTLYV